MTVARRWFLIAVLAYAAPRALTAQRPLNAPRAIDSASFAALSARVSEPGGYFDSDNVITNEASYLHVSTQLAKTGTHGGVYIGVGPDQNFSYIALVHPTIAFMLDIRRDNLLEHLLFKSLFMMSRNRTEYLCLLLGKPVPHDIDAWTDRPIGSVMAYLGETKVDSQTVAATRTASNERITRFGIPLDARDRQMIDRYRAEFVSEGLDTRYSSLGRNNRSQYPSFGILIRATDRAGKEIGYLADESAFQYVRMMQNSNRIIPVMGNVAGPKAVRAIGAYAKEQGLNVSVFYLSNVEQYLMGRDGGFDAYARNVSFLPHDSTSVIIRSYFGGRGGFQHPLYVNAPGNVSTSLVEPMDSFNHAFSAGELTSYGALVMARYIMP